MRKFACLLLILLASPLFGQGVPPIKDAEHGKGYIPLTPERSRELRAQSRAAHGGRISMLTKFTAVPAAFDCREKGWLIPTFDQGNCGSCYVDSTIRGTLTSAFVMAGYGKNDGSFVMSTQYGMDCHNFGGCNGGNGTEVIAWIMQNGWYAEKWVDLQGKVHNDYPPYAARSLACRKVDGAKVWKPATWGFVNANGKPTVAEIKAAMYKFGPLNIALDAGGQFTNGVGTITSLGRSINHEINCVGWDDNKDGGSFLLWNQWGEGWGNGGFRWCTYKAAANIVDWFFISVDPLPPPPPDPEPGPGPGPSPAPGQVLGTGKLANGQEFEMVPAGTLKRWNDLAGKVAEIQELLDGLKSEATKEPPLTKPDKRVDELEKNMFKMLEQMEKLQKLIIGQPKEKTSTPIPTIPALSRTLSIEDRIRWWESNHPQHASKP